MIGLDKALLDQVDFQQSIKRIESDIIHRAQKQHITENQSSQYRK